MVQKESVAMVRNTFRSQNVERTASLNHFWELQFSKSARGCGAKRVSKSKCEKCTTVGPVSEVWILQRCHKKYQAWDWQGFSICGRRLQKFQQRLTARGRHGTTNMSC